MSGIHVHIMEGGLGGEVDKQSQLETEHIGCYLGQVHYEAGDNAE